MTEYRRAKVKGASYFFMVDCAERQGNRLLVAHINWVPEFSEGRRMTRSMRFAGSPASYRLG
ncbi:MAG: hypothetical protein GY807_24130 [Gammaproteobacteria bacterium]|nr:hypothetical protein [Gammaproteobacteria bacterium]